MSILMDRIGTFFVSTGFVLKMLYNIANIKHKGSIYQSLYYIISNYIYYLLCFRKVNALYPSYLSLI